MYYVSDDDRVITQLDNQCYRYIYNVRTAKIGHKRWPVLKPCCQLQIQWSQKYLYFFFEFFFTNPDQCMKTLSQTSELL